MSRCYTQVGICRTVPPLSPGGGVHRANPGLGPSPGQPMTCCQAEASASRRCTVDIHVLGMQLGNNFYYGMLQNIV